MIMTFLALWIHNTLFAPTRCGNSVLEYKLLGLILGSYASTQTVRIGVKYYKGFDLKIGSAIAFQP